MKENRVLGYALTAILPAICSIALGVLLFRENVFNRAGVGFQFISLGTIGGIVYASLLYLPKLPSILIAILLLVLDEVLLHSYRLTYPWEDVLYFLGLCVVLWLSAGYFHKRLRHVVLARMLIIGALTGISYVIVTVVLYVAIRLIPSMPAFNLTQMFYYDSAQGFLLGSSLGAGVELAESFLRRIARDKGV